MAKCRRCAVPLEGRRQLCDSCKSARPGTAETVAHRKARKTAKPKSPDATETAQADPADDAPHPAPDGLKVRGRQLWSSLDAETGTAYGDLALEACRMADRLEELDRIIAGKGVLQLMKFRLEDIHWDAKGDEHVHIKVGFQSVLMEARLQQATFKDLIKELRAMKAAALPRGAAAAPAAPAAGVPAEPQATGLDEFSQRRAQRVQAP